MEDLQAQVSSIGAPAEPTRLALYRYVVGATAPVSREQAAAAGDLPLHSVKFHLDRSSRKVCSRWSTAGLNGRTGPGAGRPSKLYRRAERQVSVSLPERRYDLAGRGSRCSRRPVGTRRNADHRGGAAGGARHRLTACRRADPFSPSKPSSIHRESRRRSANMVTSRGWSTTTCV